MTQDISAVNAASKRIDWIDMAKGIAMVLVVLAHTVSETAAGSITRGVIFSFHMPLFFILSCTTFKWSSNMQQYISKLKKAAVHLLIPAGVTYVILIIVDCIRTPSLFVTGNFWLGKLYTLVFASGVSTYYSSLYVEAIGMTWFFLALFISRAVFDYLHMVLKDSYLLIVSMIIGICGILIGQYSWLPFSLDIALAIMPFLYVGCKLCSFKPDSHPLIKLLICLGSWGLCTYLTFPDAEIWSYLELAIRRYPMFPLCYIGAIAGTIVLCELSVIICRLKYIPKPFIFLGRNSLYFFCVHILDSIWISWWLVSDNQFLEALIRFLIDLAIFLLFMLARYLFFRIIRSLKARRAA